MTSLATDYGIEKGKSANGNNGANGRPLEEEQERDVVQAKAPKARMRGYRDETLSIGAKYLLAVLSDLTFLRNAGGNTRGSIVCSIRDLARWFHHRQQTIRTWRDELVRSKHIWIEMRWPWTVWHVTGICEMPDSAPRGNSHSAAMERTEFSREEPPREGGDEKRPPLFLPQSGGSDAEKAENRRDDDTQTGAVGGRKPAHMGTQTGAVVVRKPAQTAQQTGAQVDANRRTSRREPAQTATNNGADVERKPAHIRRSPVVKVGTGGTFNSKNKGPIGSQLQKEGGEGEKKPVVKDLDAEGRFLSEVTLVMHQFKPEVAERELLKYGAFWRMLYRKTPDKALRVLNDVRGGIREGRIRSNPGAVAVRLAEEFV